MKILHVDHSPVLGGAERSVVELARAQSLRGHSVCVAVGRRGAFSDRLTDAGIEWCDLEWSRRYVTATRRAGGREMLGAVPDFLRAAWALREAVERTGPDVVQAHTRKSQLVAAAAVLGRRASLVWHLRDDLPGRAPLRAAARLAIGRADHAVALSQWLARSYVAGSAMPRSGSIGIVPSGIDQRLLSALPTPWLDGQRAPVVGFVGQIARWKAPHLLVEAAEKLADRGATFRLIGGVWFPAAEQAYGRRLRARIDSSPARSAIAWSAATSQPEEAFAAIDVLVHSSIEPEPFGRVLVEAMASRRPIVALRSGAPAELLDESTAVFADRPDGRSIARAVETVLADRHAAREMAARAALRASAYEPQAVAARMDAEYERLR